MNDNTQGEDVSQTAGVAETDTASTSSSDAKTDQKAQESAGTADTKAADNKYVPYERFSEVNTKAKQLEAKIQELEGRIGQSKADIDPQKEQVKEVLKPILNELGYVSKEELRQIDEDKQVQSEISALEKQFDGSDGRPKFVRDDVVKYAIDNKIGSVEVAYRELHQKELLNWHIAKALDKSKGIKTESSDGSGSTQSGTTNEDLREAVSKGDKNALHTLLKRIVQPA